MNYSHRRYFNIFNDVIDLRTDHILFLYVFVNINMLDDVAVYGIKPQLSSRTIKADIADCIHEGGFVRSVAIVRPAVLRQ